MPVALFVLLFLALACFLLPNVTMPVHVNMRQFSGVVAYILFPSASGLDPDMGCSQYKEADAMSQLK